MRTYAFLSQVGFGDSKLERNYLYCRALASGLRPASTVESLDLGTEVEPTHLRLEATYSGSLDLSSDVGEVTAVFGDGLGQQRLSDLEALSQIVEVLNERFGLDLAESDRLFLDSIGQACPEDDTVVDQARNNTYDNFKIAFDPDFLKIALGRLDVNDGLFRRILDDTESRRRSGTSTPPRWTDGHGATPVGRPKRVAIRFTPRRA